MPKKAKPARDAFTFSLGGISAISSFVAAPAISDDLINKARDDRLNRLQEDQPDTTRELETSWGRYWLFRRRRGAA